jgi:peptidoglycan/xylan/chitin deacetylase (PgdA/CDA1 family)
VNRIPVLCYHSVGARDTKELADWELSPALFEDQMQYLLDAGYEPIRLRQLAGWLRDPAQSPLPAKPVVVTFDDAYANFDVAINILREVGIPATLFVPTAHVGETSTWYKTAAARGKTIMSWDALLDVRDAGIEIGSHGHHHVALDEEPLDTVRTETSRSKQLLEDKLGVAVDAFAYPYGWFDGSVRSAVVAAGYQYACAVKNWTSGPGDDVYAIARVFPPTSGDLSRFQRILVAGHKAPRDDEAMRTKVFREFRRLRHRLRRP